MNDFKKSEGKTGGFGCRNEDHIEGIICDVKNCQYHDCETHCTAKQVKVCPAHAEHSSDTACATFRPKADF